MKRLILIAGCAVLFAGLIAVDYKGYRTIEALRGEISALRSQVNEATEIAHRESAAATSASQRADEAAVRAETAAGARQKAEQEKQQADLGRTQALTAAQQAAEQARRAEDQMAQMRKEREEELNRMQEALNRVVETRRTPNGMVIVLPDSTFRFDFDSSELSQKNRELLSRIAGILLVSKGYGLSVFGYTDDVGTNEYNQQLSVRRAKAVEDYLVRSGIDPAIVSIKGFGKSSPLVSGTSSGARARNRRVEIALTDTSIKYGPPQ